MSTYVFNDLPRKVQQLAHRLANAHEGSRSALRNLFPAQAQPELTAEVIDSIVEATKLLEEAREALDRARRILDIDQTAIVEPPKWLW